jgi:hypothetical protein
MVTSVREAILRLFFLNIGAAAMSQAFMIAVLIAAFMLPCFAEEPVPYAHRPPSTGDVYVPALATFMRAIQFSHIKLSYAGKLGNWDLARYELTQIEVGLSDAARLYQNIPVEKIDMIDKPLVELAAMISKKDGAQFFRAFGDLTAACNSCHEAAQVSFVTIEVPHPLHSAINLLRQRKSDISR